MVQCECSGPSGEVEKRDCETYCANFDVPPDDALISITATASGINQCVCGLLGG